MFCSSQMLTLVTRSWSYVNLILSYPKNHRNPESTLVLRECDEGSSNLLWTVSFRGDKQHLKFPPSFPWPELVEDEGRILYLLREKIIPFLKGRYLEFVKRRFLSTQFLKREKKWPKFLLISPRRRRSPLPVHQGFISLREGIFVRIFLPRLMIVL